MISIPDDVDEWIRTEIHKLTIDRRDLADVLTAIDALEQRVAVSISDEAFRSDLLEVRRGLARLRLVRAVELKGDAVLAKVLFERAEALGFQSGDDRVLAAALYWRVCVSRRRVDLLEDELETALEQVPGHQDPRYLALAAKVRRLRGRR